jgi:flagellum-specific peptidoglycan hydrolase FlgJ
LKKRKLVTTLVLAMQALYMMPTQIVQADEKKPAESSSEIQNTTDDSKESTELIETGEEPTDEAVVSEETTGSSENTPTEESTETSESEAPIQEDSKPEKTPEKPVTPSKPEKKKPAEKTQESTAAGKEQPKQVDKKPASQAVESNKTAPQVNSQNNSQNVSEGTPESHFSEESSETIHFAKNETTETFILKVGRTAQLVAQENDIYGSVMIAQAILESGNGNSQLAQAPYYNLFGIKGSYKGQSVSFATQEDFGNGNLYTTQANFRSYRSYKASLEDYALLLKEGLVNNHDFYSGSWKSNTTDYKQATKNLQGKYATDSRYAEKLNALIETYDLTEYDKKITAVTEKNAKGYSVPIENYTISSPFGQRDGEFHRGLDLAATYGEPIHASKAGTVIKAEYHDSWGNVVAIEHEDGSTTLYAHQSEYMVSVGQQVKQGEVIGFVGSTGNSTGSHLHFELSQDNSLQQSSLLDPMLVLNQ